MQVVILETEPIQMKSLSLTPSQGNGSQMWEEWFMPGRTTLYQF